MSHFSTVRTELRQLEPLVQALKDLGYSPDQGERPVRGYRGQTVTADLAVAMDNGGDLGFRLNEKTGAYELVTDLDLWKQTIPVERFLSKLTQRYALNTVLKASGIEGFQVAEQQVKQDGSIELVVTRWDV
ncbi:regulator of CO2 utilization Ycf35 [Synechococcus sp. BOUM118]|nr:regulator of CO2 utilization Ycf35 [Synechococcus sp. BOUM118]